MLNESFTKVCRFWNIKSLSQSIHHIAKHEEKVPILPHFSGYESNVAVIQTFKEEKDKREGLLTAVIPR